MTYFLRAEKKFLGAKTPPEFFWVRTQKKKVQMMSELIFGPLRKITPRNPDLQPYKLVDDIVIGILGVFARCLHMPAGTR